jgi:hypothetical protein
MNRFAWVPNADEAGLTSLFERGVVPVIAPKDCDVRARRGRILQWHGLEEAPPDFAGVRHPPPRAQDAYVVAVHPEWEPPARAYAAATGRTYRRAAMRDLAALMSREPVEALVAIGPPSAFHSAALDPLRQARVPVGVLTAPDLETLTFVLAKQLAPGGARRRRHLVLRVSEHRSWECDDDAGAAIQEDSWDGARLTDLLGRDWHSLFINCHSEGAHSNLDTSVLCGRLDRVELDLAGKRVAGGCGEVDGRLVCKRVFSPDVRVVPCEELRVEQLVLMSCNGFLVAGELFPSAVSLVLGCANGFARAVLGTDRTGRHERHWMLGLSELSLRGMALSEIAFFLNGREELENGGRPWVLFGDPGPRRTQWLTLGSGGRLPDAARAVGVELGDLSPSSALGVRPGLSGQLARTATRAVYAPRERTPGAKAFLVDRSADLAEAITRLDAWSEHVQHAGRVERSIARRFREVLARDSDFTKALDRCTAVRLALEDTLQHAANIATAVRLERVWWEPLDEALRESNALVATWDEALATMLHHHVPLEALPEVRFDGVHYCTWCGLQRCDRCGTEAYGRVETKVSASMLRAAWCPACGPRELWTDDAPRLEVQVPERVRPGERVVVRVSGAPSRPGWLVAEFKDKARNCPIAQMLKQLPSPAAKFPVTLPDPLSPDVFAVSALWLSDLKCSFTRVRCIAAAQASG